MVARVDDDAAIVRAAFRFGLGFAGDQYASRGVCDRLGRGQPSQVSVKPPFERLRLVDGIGVDDPKRVAQVGLPRCRDEPDDVRP